MKKLIFILCLCFVAIAPARAKGVIAADGVDQSEDTHTLHRGQLQVENGSFIAQNTQLNNFMLRYGINNTTEARLLLDAGTVGVTHAVGSRTYRQQGLQPVIVGLKQHVMPQRGVLPAVALSSYFSLDPLASKVFRERDVDFEIRAAFENELSDKLSLCYNFGASDDFRQLNLTAALSFSATDHLSTFVEYFSFTTDSGTEHNVDAGVQYLITPRFYADLAVGRGIFSSENRYFITFGVAYLFN